MKKIIALIMSICIIIVGIPISALAVEDVPAITVDEFASRLYDIQAQYDTEYYQPLLTDSNPSVKIPTRLIITAPHKVESYGAVETIEGYKNLHIFQYETAEAASAAIESIREFERNDAHTEYGEKHDLYLEYDMLYKNLGYWPSAAAYSGEKLSWGGDYAGYDSFINTMSEEALNREVKVAVIGDGVNYNHDYYKANPNRYVQSGFNVSGAGDKASEMCYAEETFFAGTCNVVGNIVDNTTDNVKVSCYKCANDKTLATKSGIVCAMYAAAEDCADILSMDVNITYDGGSNNTGILYRVQKELYNAGITICAPSNMYNNYTKFNADYCILAHCIDKKGKEFDVGTNYPRTEIYAPGVGIEGIGFENDDYSNKHTGNPYASAFVTAAAALIKAVYPEYTPQQIESCLILNGTKTTGFKTNAPILNMTNAKNIEWFDVPEAPVICTVGGVYTDSVTVTLEPADEKTEVYYKVMPDTPFLDKYKKNVMTKYTEPIVITERTKLAICSFFKDDVYGINPETPSTFSYHQYSITYTEENSNFEIDENGVITLYNGNKKDVVVPETINGITVTGLGKHAFHGALKAYETIETLTLPDTCTMIKDSAFYWCDNLTAVYANNIRIVDDHAFANCDNLEYFDFSKVEKIGSMAFGSNELIVQDANKFTEINLPNCTEIESDAFQASHLVETIKAPLVKTINMDTFYYCTSLEAAYFDNATTIKAQAFSHCPKLKEVYAPKVTKLTKNAFNNCDSLKSLSLPSLVDDSNGGLNMKASTTTQIEELFLPSLEVTYGFPEYSTTLYLSENFRECQNNTDGVQYTVVAPAGTYAEEWANEYGHIFIDSNTAVSKRGRSIRVTDAGLRFGFNWNDLDEIEETADDVEYGFVYAYSNTDDLDVANGKKRVANAKTSDNGKTSFNLVFTDIPKTNYDTEISARAYVSIDGMVFYSPILHGSFKEVATLVINDRSVDQGIKDSLSNLLEG